MPGLPVYHQVGGMPGSNNAPNQNQNITNLGSGTSGNHVKFVIWLLIIGVLVPGLVLGALDFYGFRFVFKHR